MVRPVLAALLIVGLSIAHGAGNSASDLTQGHGSAWIHMKGNSQSALPREQLRSNPVGNTVTVERLPSSPGPKPCYDWVPGYYTWTWQNVWVPGPWVQEYVSPVYETQWYDGQPAQVLVQDGYWQWVQMEGHYERQQVQIWIPGRWVCVPCK